MPAALVLLPSAKSDLQSAVDWYEKRQIGLGHRFKLEVINAIDSLDNPIKEHNPALLTLSRIFVKNFPYLIYFKKDTLRQRIVVYAILHEKQDRDIILTGRL